MTDDRRRRHRRVAADRRVRGASDRMDAVVVHRWGDPSVLEPGELEIPMPAEGEALVRVEYSGVNYVDVYHRTGLYAKEPPFVPGVEAAGVVEEVGPGTTGVEVGQRVACAMVKGTYAEYMVVPAWKLVPVPDAVESRVAAAVMVQGMTAHFLSHDAYPIAEGDTVLVHAAAGGVGLLLTQLAKMRGATVIGTCSTEEKEQLAREAGADHVIRYTDQDFREETMSLTDGRGVAAVYDSVGRTTFERSLACLRPRGFLVLFGQASGPVAPVDPRALVRQGSVYLTRPSLVDYMRDERELRDRASHLFDHIERNRLDVRVDRIFGLQDAATAHEILESRASAGKLLLEVA